MTRVTLFVLYLSCIIIVCNAAPSSNEDITSGGTSELLGNTEQKEAPKYLIADDDIELCNKNSSSFGDCLKNIFNIMVPRLSKGNKELGIPPYEPFSLNKTTLDIKSDLINGRITVKNTKIYGISTGKTDKVEMRIIGDKFKSRYLSSTAETRLVGNYKGEFRLNNANLKPKGTFNVTLFNVKLESRSEGIFYEKDGHKFVRMTSFNTSPKIGDIMVDITGIFDDPALNELALEVIKRYWRDVLDVVVPQTRQFWEPLMIRITNEIIARIPFDNFVKNS